MKRYNKLVTVRLTKEFLKLVNNSLAKYKNKSRMARNAVAIHLSNITDTNIESAVGVGDKWFPFRMSPLDYRSIEKKVSEINEIKKQKAFGDKDPDFIEHSDILRYCIFKELTKNKLNKENYTKFCR